VFLLVLLTLLALATLLPGLLSALLLLAALATLTTLLAGLLVALLLLVRVLVLTLALALALVAVLVHFSFLSTSRRVGALGSRLRNPNPTLFNAWQRSE